MASFASKLNFFARVINQERHLITRNIVPKSRLTKCNYADKPSWPPEKLRKKMELFQADTGVPLYRKAGASDRILIGITLALLAIGMVDGLTSMISMAVPKNKA